MFTLAAAADQVLSWVLAQASDNIDMTRALLQPHGKETGMKDTVAV